MSDSLERFLKDLEFQVPDGLVDRAKAAAAVDEPERPLNGREVGHPSRDGAKEQSELGNPALPHERSGRNGLRDRHTPRSRRTALVEGIAAVVLAAIVIGSFAYIRSVLRPHAVAAPSCLTAPWCTPLNQPLNVAPATPVILFYDPTNPARWTSPDMPPADIHTGSYQIDGMTWDGQISVKVAGIPYPDPQQYVSTASPSNPAGTLFVAFPNLLNRSGQVVAKLSGGLYTGQTGGNNFNAGNNFLGMWADDELQYCQVGTSSNAVPATLQLTTPGGTPRDVTQLGGTAVGMYMAACSVLADRAVVVQSGSNGPAQYWVVQLSSGRVLWKRDLTGNNKVIGLVASRDGRYVAEIDWAGQTTAIYGANGSAVGHINGSVWGFSWDGSLVVVEPSVGPQVSVVRWLDGTTVWTGPNTGQFGGSQPEPGGTSLAIEMVDFNHPFMDHGTGKTFGFPTHLYVVSSDGRVLVQREVGGMLGFP